METTRWEMFSYEIKKKEKETEMKKIPGSILKRKQLVAFFNIQFLVDFEPYVPIKITGG